MSIQPDASYFSRTNPPNLKRAVWNAARTAIMAGHRKPFGTPPSPAEWDEIITLGVKLQRDSGCAVFSERLTNSIQQGITCQEFLHRYGKLIKNLDPEWYKWLTQQ